MQNKYKPPNYCSDIDEGIFEYPEYGRCAFKPSINHEWHEGDRTDIITFDEDRDAKELFKHLKIGSSVSPDDKDSIISMVKEHWDAFCSDGCRRPIIGYEFAIDTGSATPVCKYTITSAFILQLTETA